MATGCLIKFAAWVDTYSFENNHKMNNTWELKTSNLFNKVHDMYLQNSDIKVTNFYGLLFLCPLSVQIQSCNLNLYPFPKRRAKK